MGQPLTDRPRAHHSHLLAGLHTGAPACVHAHCARGNTPAAASSNEYCHVRAGRDPHPDSGHVRTGRDPHPDMQQWTYRAMLQLVVACTMGKGLRVTVTPHKQ